MASRTMKKAVVSRKQPVAIKTMPWVVWLVVLMLVITGVGATPAGYSMLVDPSGAGLGMDTEWLSTNIFPNFLVPGIFLFGLIGIGSLLVALFLVWRPNWKWAQALNPFRKMHWSWTAAMGLGLALVVWITVQVLSVELFSVLQPTFFAFGVATMVIMALPAVRRHYTA